MIVVFATERHRNRSQFNWHLAVHLAKVQIYRNETKLQSTTLMKDWNEWGNRKEVDGGDRKDRETNRM